MSDATRQDQAADHSAEERFPALRAAFEVMLLAYQEAGQAHDRVTSRAGVALTVTIGAFAALGASAGGALVGLTGPWRTVAVLAAGAGVAFLLLGIVLLVRALLTKALPAGHSTADLLEFEWKKPLDDFYLQQLSNLREGAAERQRDAERRSRNFNAGLQVALFGALLLIAETLVATLVGGGL